MTEIWKDIYYYDFIKNKWIDYRNLYQVSNLGKIKSLKKVDAKGNMRKEKILKNRYDNDGYVMVSLYKDGISEQIKLHRIVAFVFIDNPQKKHYVDHIVPIRNGGGNEFYNLRWATLKENSNNFLSKENQNKKKYKPVVSFNLITKQIKLYLTVKDVINDGFDNSNVVKCCKGKQKTSGLDDFGNKIKWFYVDDYYDFFLE